MLWLSGCSDGKFEGVHEVDRLLSHPDDPARMAEGVPMDSIVPGAALHVAQLAVEEYPETPRFYYLLGRAYLASGAPEAAESAFLEAAKRNYVMAHYNLGLEYAQRISSEESQQIAVRHFYAAYEGGIAQAQQRLRRVLPRYCGHF